MRRLLLSLVAMVLLGFGQQATHAQDSQNYILSQSYYLDQSNDLTYDEAKSVTFTPYQGLLTGGFSKGAYWVKLGIRAHSSDLVLKIRPAYTNEITLYDPLSSKTPRTTGSVYPIGMADIEATSFNFVLPPSAETREVYLRIKSVSSYLMYVEAMPTAEFERAERTDNLIYTGYVMLTLILAVWLLITWMTNRERVIGAFAIQQTIAFAHTFIKVGFARAFLDRYISDALINEVSNVIVVFYPFVGLIVNKLLLQEYGLGRSFRYGFNAILAFSLGIIILYLSGHQLTALSINAPFVLAIMVWFLVCVFWGANVSKAKENSNGVQLNVLRLFYTFNLLVWIVALLPLLGIVSTGPIALHSLFVYNMMSSLVFFILLQYRARWLLRHEVARASTLKAEAAQERQRREEQSMLLAMLSHEIKTPLSVLKLVMEEKVAGSDLEGHANRAVSNINFIVNRCLQLGKLDARAIQLNPTNIHVEEFLLELLPDLQDSSRVRISVPVACCVRTDKEIIRVVISNLIENGLKYGDKAQSVIVQVQELSEAGVHGVRFDVSNSIGALGVPDADQVFKKYYRNTQATKVAGSGLGLFLVHELVGVMGGKVMYVSENDKVLFSVWIPA